MNSEKKFIYTSLGLLIVSIIFLAFLGAYKMNDGHENGLWTAYFNTPDDNSLDFSVENDSKSGRFNWEIYQGGSPVDKGFFNAEKGEIVIVSPKADIVPSGVYLIKISGPNGTKEIYKLLK